MRVRAHALRRPIAGAVDIVFKLDCCVAMMLDAARLNPSIAIDARHGEE